MFFYLFIRHLTNKLGFLFSSKQFEHRHKITMIDDVIIKINVLFILFNGRRETFADIQAKLGKVIGMGNMMVELCSADIEFRVCRYRS